jgi:uncharacterized protein
VREAAVVKLVFALFAICISTACLGSPEPTEAERKDRAAQLLQLGVEAFQNNEHALAAHYYVESIRSWPIIRAVANLCNMFLYGYGVERDYQQAFQLCEVAAQADDAHALVMMGEMHLHGHGVSSNRDAALSFYRRAAELAHVHGQFMTGYLLREVRSTRNEARYWLRRAHEAGHEHAGWYLESLGGESDEE